MTCADRFVRVAVIGAAFATVRQRDGPGAQRRPEARNMVLVGYRPAGPQRLPADHPEPGRSLDRLRRPPRRHGAQPAHRPARRQRHVDRRRHRPAQPTLPRAHPRRAGRPRTGGAQMVRVCDGSDLPQGRQEQGLPAAHLRQHRARDLGRHRPGQADARHDRRQRTPAARIRTGGNATPASPTWSPARPDWRTAA